MKNYYGHKILPEHNLILKYYKGTIDLNDMIACMSYTAKDPNFSPNLNVINDFRDVNIDMSQENILKFILIIQGNPQLYDKRDIVFITNTQNQVIFTTCLDFYKNESMINIYTVSTYEKALDSLSLNDNISLDEIEFNFQSIMNENLISNENLFI